MMGCIPRQACRLDVTWLETHVVLRITRRRCTSLPLLFIGRRPRCVVSGDGPVTVVLVLENARIPLADEAAPILNIQICCFCPYSKCRGLVSVRGSSQEINAVVVPGR